jgi:hypothetical protein
MSPESQSPAPKSEGFITPPPFVQENSDAVKRREEQEFAARTAAAAQKFIAEVPGVETPQPQPAPLITNGLGGRSGLGVIPVDMPADPSHVVGWNDDVKKH